MLDVVILNVVAPTKEINRYFFCIFGGKILTKFHFFPEMKSKQKAKGDLFIDIINILVD